MSRIGKKPIELPSGVSASISGQTVEVKGPKGSRNYSVTDDVNIVIEDGVVSVSPRGGFEHSNDLSACYISFYNSV